MNLCRKERRWLNPTFATQNLRSLHYRRDAVEKSRFLIGQKTLNGPPLTRFSFAADYSNPPRHKSRFPIGQGRYVLDYSIAQMAIRLAGSSSKNAFILTRLSRCPIIL